MVKTDQPINYVLEVGSWMLEVKLTIYVKSLQISEI